MNYIKQVNAFYELLPNNPLNSNAQCLYFNLLNLNNKCNWKKEFTVSNTLLMAYTSLNISSLQRARNTLVQKGYIKYTKGNNQYQCGIYEVVIFEQATEQANEQASEQADEQATEKQTNRQPHTLDKLNKTKQKNKENKKEKSTEFDEILKTKVQDEEIKSAFYDFIKMRKAIKKPLTTRGLELAIDKLNKLSQNKEEQILIINKSIMNNWQGLFELNSEDKKDLNKQKQVKENRMTEEEYFKSGGGKRYV